MNEKETKNREFGSQCGAEISRTGCAAKLFSLLGCRVCVFYVCVCVVFFMCVCVYFLCVCFMCVCFLCVSFVCMYVFMCVCVGVVVRNIAAPPVGRRRTLAWPLPQVRLVDQGSGLDLQVTSGLTCG